MNLLLVAGSIGFSILALFLLKPMFSHTYLQVIDLVLVLTSAGFAIASFYYLIKNEVIILESSKIVVKSFWGLSRKEYQLNSLNSYTAIQKENKYIKWEDLDLFFDDSKLRITSSNFELSKYQILKNQITKGKKENHERTSQWASNNAKNLGIGFVIIGLIFSQIFINQNKQGNKIINSSNTNEISGMLSVNPELKTGRKKKKSIELKFQEFPDFTFKLNGSELKAINTKDFFSDIDLGDKLLIKIWKDTYFKKIEKSKKLSFADKHFNYHQIDILGIKKNNIDYLPEKLINQNRSKFHTKTNFYGLMAFALFMIGFGTYLITISRIAR